MGEFEKIGEETIRRAQKVECSAQNYVAGLQEIIDKLTDEVGAANEKIK